MRRGDETQTRRRAKLFIAVVLLLLTFSSVAYAELAARSSDKDPSATPVPGATGARQQTGRQTTGPASGSFGAANPTAPSSPETTPEAREAASASSGSTTAHKESPAMAPAAAPAPSASPGAADRETQAPARTAEERGTAPARSEQPPPPREAPQGGEKATVKGGSDGADAATAPEDQTLYLTVPRLGLYANTVRNESSEGALGLGAIHLPETGFPWERGSNVYMACHRLGFPGTQSYNQCLNLPSIQKGDEIILKDSLGRTYYYRVTGTREVSPYDSWIANPVPGKDLVSLQTCIESVGDYATLGPSWSARFVVQAERA